MKRLVAALALTVGLLTACGPGYETGPAGTVTGRARTHYRAGFHYWLTVTTPDGHRSTFRVRAAHYNRCFHGSHYPACTHRSVL